MAISEIRWRSVSILLTRMIKDFLWDSWSHKSSTVGNQVIIVFFFSQNAALRGIVMMANTAMSVSWNEITSYVNFSVVLRIRVLFYTLWFLLARLFSPLLLTHFAVSVLNVLYFYIHWIFYLASEVPFLYFVLVSFLSRGKMKRITFSTAGDRWD